MRIIYIVLILPCFLALLNGAPQDNTQIHHDDKDDKGVLIKTIVSVCYKLVNYFILFMYYQPLLNRIYNEFVKIFGNTEAPPYEYDDIIEATTRRHHHHHHHPRHHHPHRHHHHRHHFQEEERTLMYNQSQNLLAKPINEDTTFSTKNSNSKPNQQRGNYSEG